MEKYSFLGNANPEEVAYYKKIIDTATWNGTKQVEGLYAVEFFQKSGLGLDILSQIWEKSWILKLKYLSPPEIIIYCKYIAMYQNNIPLTYENLAMYNSQLPYPKFNFSVGGGVGLGQPPVQAPVGGFNTAPQMNAPASAPPQAQPAQQQEEEDDGFGDFMDSNAAPPQLPPKELTEEEKKKKEEEERLKRLDLISSAFDDALFTEEEPQEEKKAEPEVKPEDQLPPGETVQSEQPPVIQEDSKVEQPQQDSMGWASFADPSQPQPTGTSWKEESVTPGWGDNAFPSEDKKPEAEEPEDDGFGDFADPVEAETPQPVQTEELKIESKPIDDDPFAEILIEESQPKETKVETEVKEEVQAEPIIEPEVEKKEQPEKEAFPSIFNTASTPRVDNDMDSDIRMSFPSQEMWGNNFGEKKEEKAKEEAPKQGWASGAFEFKPTEPAKDTIKEEDAFQDIMDLKNDQKESDDTGFGDFTTPEPKSEIIESKPDEKEDNAFGNFGKETKPGNDWGDFRFSEAQKPDLKVEEKQEEGAGWATFTDPQPSKEESVEKETKNDPFASAEDPFKDAFSSDKKEKEKEKSDDDSDFGDFAEPVEKSETSTPATKIEITPGAPQESEVTEEKIENFNIDTTPAKTKEFNEKEMFKGFMKAVSEISKSHPSHPEKEESNDVAPASASASEGRTVSIKSKLMEQVAKAFGESGDIDLDHLTEVKATGVTIESLQGKLEDKAAMDSIAQQLVKQENYKGAEKIWKHNEIVEKIANILEQKKAAAANEEFEQAMKLRDEANELKSSLLSEQQVVDLFDQNEDHHEPTLKFLLNQVLYRVDDSTAEYFIPKFLKKLEEIDDKDFEGKVALKREVMAEALILLKVTKVGIDAYKKNCDEVVPFLIREVNENYTLLTDLCKQPSEILDALKEEEKFLTFLKGIKALAQIMKNFQESTEILDLIDTKYAMDIEVFWQEIQQGIQKVDEIKELLDADLGISKGLMKAKIMTDKILGSEEGVEEGFKAIQRDKYNCIWSLCGTYILNSEDEKENSELHLPERRLVFNNIKEEQQTYHNYCINLWINRISANPN